MALPGPAASTASANPLIVETEAGRPPPVVENVLFVSVTFVEP